MNFFDIPSGRKTEYIAKNILLKNENIMKMRLKLFYEQAYKKAPSDKPTKKWSDQKREFPVGIDN